ncbi:metallophosphoesterase family protein [Oceanobacillus massiliensis]|uniref:metallophosphoesterase family protein n=1 Tax=Oceanobacillus massiliensis TaxID=1465765 RepID=UPI000288494D|nr:DNA repair exonuclease [Oceanobacillus massiliensis]
MAEQVSFIHAADLHLDSPFKGMAHAPASIFQEMRESTFMALDHLVEAAIDRNVDFLVIAGDLFDNEKQSLKAQIRLRKSFERLQKHGINVYLSYGNHDYIKGNVHPVAYPDNVFIFSGEKVSHFTFMKDGKELARIYGFSYENRAVLDRKAAEYKICNPQIPFHIAMLHGSIVSNTEHDVYAPFQINELLKENFHYWALGHIHKREILKQSPPILYPGNLQGRNRKETGEKGCYHVILRENETKLSFLPLQAIQFQAIEISVSECKQIHDLEKFILNALAEADTPQLLDVTLRSESIRLKEWENEKLVEDVIDLVNETTSNQQNWKFIFRVSVHIDTDIYGQELLKETHFIGELSHHFEKESILPFVSELYQHRQARKYLNVLSEEEEQEIKEEAKQLLVNELLKG